MARQPPEISGAPSLDDIRTAREALRSVVRETPLIPSEEIGVLVGRPTFLKAESLQRLGSFKLRGAYVRIAALSEAERARGVIASSAGNHGQGVALAAGLLGVRATIVLPENAPLSKVTAIQGLGARTILHGGSYEAAYQKAHDVAQSEAMTFIHPYDDWQIIAGQGTVALEIADQLPDVATLVVPVGGGGLIAGSTLALKALRPGVSIIGVQAAGACGAVASFQAGRRVRRPAETIADGIKVAEPGVKPFQVIRRFVDAMVTVEEEEIYRAVVFLLESAKLVVEPAGAVGVAALLTGKVRLPSEGSVVALLSGGNVDPNVLVHLIEYGLVHSGRSLVLRVMLPDRPGALVRLLEPLAEHRANILEIQHRRAIWGLPVGVSEVLLHLETRGPAHVRELLADLNARGFPAEPILPGSKADIALGQPSG